jgi:reductive dehalogenase
MKIMRKRAHQIYNVSPEYRRFDQKFNMQRRSTWDWVDYGKNLLQNRTERIRKRTMGYSLKDWALVEAVDSTLHIAKTDINVPNKGHSSWSRILAMLPPGVERLNEEPGKMSRHIRKVARLFGADLVGITKLDKRWVYSRWYDEETRVSHPIHFSDETNQSCQTPIILEDRRQVIPKEMENVIAMVVSMDKAGMDAAPTLTQYGTVRRAYAQLGFLALGIAEFIRGLGYHALPMINDTMLNVPLAVDAGLGQLGRHGLLITPLFGPRVRICKVLTDLPLEIEWPIDFGVTAFCDICKKCAEQCPAGAISQGERSYEARSISSNGNVLKWEFDAEKCRRLHMEIGTACGICIRTCPFNKSTHWSHSVVRWFIEKIPGVNSFWVKMDDILTYGELKDPEKSFWQSS